jgi:acetyl esterase/lipase
VRSLGYRIAAAVARRVSHREIFQYTAEELEDFLTRTKDTRKTAPPEYILKRHTVREETINGRPCYIIAPKPGGGKPEHATRFPPKPDKTAILFLHGGGFVNEAHPVHWRAVSELVRRLGITVWFPAYPLISGKPAGDPVQYPGLADITAMAAEFYRRMLEAHPSSKIIFLGDSAGAGLSLMFCHHNKALGMPLPMPDKLILLSPAMLTEQAPAILEAMRRIEKRDVMLAMPFMDSMIRLLDLDLSRDNYFNAPLYGDFRGFPAMEVYSGTWEIFYPQIPPFVERVKQAGVTVTLHVGAEMMHIWPYIPIARECRTALNQIMENL